MKPLSRAKSKAVASLSKGLVALALFAGLSSTASAQLHDPVHTFSNVVLSGKELAQLTAQYNQLKQQYENLQKNLVTVQGLQMNNLSMEDPFKERDLTFGMQARCPGPIGSMNPKELLTAFVINPKSNLKQIKEEQHKICQRIVLAENTKYNETVKALNFIREQEGKLKQIGDRRAQVSDKPGALDANNNDIMALSARAKESSQYVEAVIKAYDDYIENLNLQQQMLTEMAMRGNQNDDGFIEATARKMAQGQILKGALNTIGDRER